MEKTTIYTNDFYWTDEYRASVHDDVDQALADGFAVCVSPSCIGHTRAEMVRHQAKRYFERVGAVEVERRTFGDVFYAMP